MLNVLYDSITEKELLSLTQMKVKVFIYPRFWILDRYKCVLYFALLCFDIICLEVLLFIQVKI